MASVQKIDSKTLSEWLKKDQAVLVDVREPGEYRSERIAHAKNLPLSLVNIDEAHLPEHRHKKLVLHCRSGRRAQMACEKLLQEGVDYDIWNLEGGIDAWKASGLPIATGQRKVIPLDRQIQIVVGSLVFTTVLLGMNVNESYLFLSAFFGAALVFAGVTGWCGVGKLLSLMPWNK